MRTEQDDDGDEEEFPGGTESFEDTVRAQYYKAIADETRNKAEMSVRQI